MYYIIIVGDSSSDLMTGLVLLLLSLSLYLDGCGFSEILPIPISNATILRFDLLYYYLLSRRSFFLIIIIIIITRDITIMFCIV